VAEPFGSEISRRLRSAGGFPELATLIGDPSPRVRGQLAFSLGEWPGPECGDLLGRLALRDFDQPHLRTAILSSATNHVAAMLRVALNGHDSAPPRLLEQLLGLAASLKRDDCIGDALDKVSQPGRDGGYSGWQLAALAAFLDALDRRNQSIDGFSTGGAVPPGVVAERIGNLFAHARRLASRKPAVEADRLAAIRLLGRSEAQRSEDIVQLGNLLRPENSSAIQRAAIGSLVRLKENPAAEALLAGWNGHSPAVREDVLGGILGRSAWVLLLLSRVEEGAIPARQISAVWQQKLLRHRDPAIRGRAERLFTVATSDRRGLLDEYASVARLKGDAGHGVALFRQHCAVCHRLGGDGKAVGPDLGMITDKSVDALLAAILDPNQAVEARFVSYTAMTRADREVGGIIITESASGITLRSGDGREETLLRADLKELTSSGLSLMPEGFEQVLRPQDMADLIAALTTQ
jgi:putative heme-binding domain-containing protein